MLAVRSIAVVLSFCLVILVGLWWLMTSLWLVWFLTPAADLRVAWSAADPLVSIFATDLAGELPISPTQVKAIGMSISQDQPVLVVLPKLRSQHQVSVALYRAGWRVERIGLALRATQLSQTVATPSFWRALQATIRTVIGSRLPAQPVAVAEGASGEVPLLDGSWSAVAQRTGAGLVVYLGEEVLDVHQLTFGPLPVLSEQRRLVVSVPGVALAALSESGQSAWNALLAKLLGLSFTEPAIIRYVAQFPHVSLELDGDKFALGVRGAGETFAETVQTWLAEDARYSHLEPRWFQLPDGTLGQELAPGEAPKVFAEKEAGCQRTTREEYPLILCSSAASGIIASSRTYTQSLEFADQWHISVPLAAPPVRELLACEIGEGRVQKLLCQLQLVHLIGTPQGATILLR